MGDKYYNILRDDSLMHSPEAVSTSISPRSPTHRFQAQPASPTLDKQDAQSSTSGSSLDIFERETAIPLAPTGLDPHDGRSLGVFDSIALIVGSMIGSGIFIAAGPIYAYTNSVIVSIIVWVVGGILSMLGALCYAELGTLISDNGGEYAYLLEAFGQFPALAFIWIAITILKTGSVAILSSVCSKYTYRLLTLSLDGPLSQATSSFSSMVAEKLLTFSFLMSAVLINCFSDSLAARLQRIFFATKLIAIAMISLAGLYQLIRGTGQGPLPSAVASEPTDVSMTSLLLALQTALYGYDGWNNLSYVGAKVLNPSYTVPRAIVGSVVIVMIAYISCNIGYFIVLPADHIKKDNGMAVEFGKIAFGTFGQVIIPLFIICSSYSALNASLYSTSHIVQTASMQSHFPAVFAASHPQWGTPVRALLLQAVLAGLMALSSQAKTMMRYTAFVWYLFFGLSVVGLLVLRYVSPKWKYIVRPYRVWPTTAVLFVLVCAWMVVVSVLNDLLHSVYLLLWISFGFACWAAQQVFERREYNAPIGYSQAQRSDDYEL